MKKLIYISLVIIGLSSCKKAGDLFTSYGPETTEVREVGSFSKIKAGEKFDIILVQDSAKAGRIEMTAGSHVIDGYTTKVENDELVISNENKFNWVRKLKVRQKVVVYFNTLNHLQINGSAKFISRDTIVNTNTFEVSHGGLEDAELLIKGDYIYVNSTNTGGIHISGKCFLLSSSVDDIGYINAANLLANKVYITSFSQDDSYVNAEAVLEINLYGNGSVYYKDRPLSSITLNDKGKGKINPFN